MDHIAILRKSNIKKGDNLLKAILDGKKTIESRWYVHKIAPWNNIKIGETIFFKESGCPVTAKALISDVIQYDNLTPTIIEEIIVKYGKLISPGTNLESFLFWGKKQVKKKYCILVFLKDIEKIEPFNINKQGFGISAAWLTTQDINRIKI